MGGYSDDLFNRIESRLMVAEGFAAGTAGRRDFATRYGVMESIEKIPDQDNAFAASHLELKHILACATEEMERRRRRHRMTRATRRQAISRETRNVLRATSPFIILRYRSMAEGE
jgi:hypothetical protein